MNFHIVLNLFCLLIVFISCQNSTEVDPEKGIQIEKFLSVSGNFVYYDSNLRKGDTVCINEGLTFKNYTISISDTFSLNEYSDTALANYIDRTEFGSNKVSIGINTACTSSPLIIPGEIVNVLDLNQNLIDYVIVNSDIQLSLDHIDKHTDEDGFNFNQIPELDSLIIRGEKQYTRKLSAKKYSSKEWFFDFYEFWVHYFPLNDSINQIGLNRILLSYNFNVTGTIYHIDGNFTQLKWMYPYPVDAFTPHFYTSLTDINNDNDIEVLDVYSGFETTEMDIWVDNGGELLKIEAYNN